MSGEIPGALVYLAELEYLFLSGNRLSGCIPLSLRKVGTHDLEKLGLPDCATPTPTATPTPATTERGALIALYEATDGANWKRSDNWLSDAPLSDWYGVTTDASGRVTELRLRNNGLSGPLPDLSLLSNLTSLVLIDNNRLRGPDSGPERSPPICAGCIFRTMT